MIGGSRRRGGAIVRYVDGWGTVGLLLVVGVAFVVVALSTNRLLRPDRARGDALSTYECGVDPVGEGWAQTQIRYYVYAFLYVVFAVEAVYLFPWATIYARPEFGAAALGEMGVFVGLLALGIVYAWRKRVLTWV
jgi:NADH-quinone oxidoreductase subunit A